MTMGIGKKAGALAALSVSFGLAATIAPTPAQALQPCQIAAMRMCQANAGHPFNTMDECIVWWTDELCRLHGDPILWAVAARNTVD